MLVAFEQARTCFQQSSAFQQLAHVEQLLKYIREALRENGSAYD